LPSDKTFFLDHTSMIKNLADEIIVAKESVF
jgi:hypothetical protein